MNYEFYRPGFPAVYNNHRISILNNQAVVRKDGRLQFHLVLYCQKCGEVSVRRGRLPSQVKNPLECILAEKFAVFGPFLIECDENHNG